MGGFLQWWAERMAEWLSWIRTHDKIQSLNRYSVIKNHPKFVGARVKFIICLQLAGARTHSEGD